MHLTEEQAERLRRVAAERGLSMAAVIREAADQMSAAEDEEARWNRALTAVGTGASGRSDVSTYHDRHLGQTYGRDGR